MPLDNTIQGSTIGGPTAIKKGKKSRNGCLTCKKKRLKCDETKPNCLNCTKKNIECGGYATKFKWKSFNEEKSHTSSSTKSLKRHLELASFSVTGKSIEEVNKENELIAKGINPETVKNSTINRSRTNSVSTVNTQRTKSFDRSHSIPIPSNEHAQLQSASVYKSDLNSLADAAMKQIGKTPASMSSTPPALKAHHQHPAQSLPGDSAMLHMMVSQPPQPPPPFTPNFEAMLTTEKPTIKRNGFGNFDSEINLTPSLSAILNFAFNHEEVEVPSVETLSPLTLNHEARVDASMTNNKPITEQEQILHLFNEHTSGIMSIKNGVHENPWRNLIAPLATKYPCLFNSIAAMTSFHMAGSNNVVHSPEDLRTKGWYYMKKCIFELANGLSNNVKDLPLDVALVTCLNLAVCEQWDTHTSSGIAHLKGAKSMIQQILELLKEQQQFIKQKKFENIDSISSVDEDQELLMNLKKKLVLVDDLDYEEMIHETIKCPEKSVVIPKSIQFILNNWIYFEVLAQMTSDSMCDDKGVDLVAAITSMSQNKLNKDKDRNPKSPSEASDLSDKTFRFFETLNLLNYNNEVIDPLLGCSQSLFVIMGKVANLITKIRKAKHKSQSKKRNTLTTISQASELKQELVNWKPSVVASIMDNEISNESSTTWDLPLCIATAEAYKYSTLLYLHQAVPEIPSFSAHALAEKIFILLASIPTSSNLSIVHIFPLLVASSEAEPGEEREWCENRWKLLSQRMWIGNIDRALEVVKEVWRRKDGLQETCEDRKFHQLGGLMVALNGDPNNNSNGGSGGNGHSNGNLASNTVDANTIDSKTHWSTVMKEWGWEVLLG